MLKKRGRKDYCGPRRKADDEFQIPEYQMPYFVGVEIAESSRGTHSIGLVLMVGVAMGAGAWTKVDMASSPRALASIRPYRGIEKDSFDMREEIGELVQQIVVLIVEFWSKLGKLSWEFNIG